MGDKQSFRIEPIPAMHRFTFDAGYLGRSRHIVHGLIEVDVKKAHECIREFLDLTVSVDHDIVDGAPAARFIQSFRARLEEAKDLPPNTGPRS